MGGGAGQAWAGADLRLANGSVPGLQRLRLLSAHVGFARGAWWEHRIIYNLLSARKMLSDLGSAQDLGREAAGRTLIHLQGPGVARSLTQHVQSRECDALPAPSAVVHHRVTRETSEQRRTRDCRSPGEDRLGEGGQSSCGRGGAGARLVALGWGQVSFRGHLRVESTRFPMDRRQRVGDIQGWHQDCWSARRRGRVPGPAGSSGSC